MSDEFIINYEDFDLCFTAYISEDSREFDITECYIIKYPECETHDVNWKDFDDVICDKIEPYLPASINTGFYGGYDDYLDGYAKSFY